MMTDNTFEELTLGEYAARYLTIPDIIASIGEVDGQSNTINVFFTTPTAAGRQYLAGTADKGAF